MFDPFAILGLPRRFDLSRAEVERAYLTRAAAAHPDLTGEEHEVGGSDLNRARQALLDPETRANVLLGLLGGPSKEQDRTLPAGFLVEMMQVRERMEADAAAGDAGSADRWKHWAEVQRNQHQSEASELFAKLSGGVTADTLKAMRVRLNAWRYIERMLEQIEGGQR